jgi:hypothetical protein
MGVDVGIVVLVSVDVGVMALVDVEMGTFVWVEAGEIFGEAVGIEVAPCPHPARSKTSEKTRKILFIPGFLSERLLPGFSAYPMKNYMNLVSRFVEC